MAPYKGGAEPPPGRAVGFGRPPRLASLHGRTRRGGAARRRDPHRPGGRAHRRGREPVRRGLAGRGPVDTWFEIRPGDNLPPRVALGRLPRLRRPLPLRGLRVLRPRPGADPRPVLDRDDISAASTTAGSSSTPATTAAPASSSWPRRAGSSTTRSRTTPPAARTPSPDFYWDSAGQHHARRLGARDPHPVLLAALLRTATPRPGASCSSATTRASSATRSSRRGSRGAGTASSAARTCSPASRGCPSGGHLVVAPYAAARAARRSRAATPGAPLGERPSEVTAASTSSGSRTRDNALDAHRQPRLLPGRVGRGADLRQRALRALLPREAAVLPRGRRSCSRRRIQAVYTRADHVAALGPARHRQDRRHRLHRPRRRRPRRRQRHPPGPDGSSLRRPGLLVARRRRPGAARPRQLVRELPRDRPRDRRAAATTGCSARTSSGGRTRRTRSPGSSSLSLSETPDRPDLAAEWDGRTLSGGGVDVWWSHTTPHASTLGLEVKAFGDGFRADDGFVPQVGFREGYARGGVHLASDAGSLTRVRAFAFTDPMWDSDGEPHPQPRRRRRRPGRPLELLRPVRVCADRVAGRRAGTEPATFREIPKNQLRFIAAGEPVAARSRSCSSRASLGEEIDFENARPGARRHAHPGRAPSGRPTTSRCAVDASRRWLDVRPDGGGPESRLFTAQVERLKATYTLQRAQLPAADRPVRADRRATPRSTADAGRGDERRRSPARSLFAYKLNWQSVLFLGYGDDRALQDRRRPAPAPAGSSS